MPVGTRGTVKGVEVGLWEETGAQIVLGNTYHLMLRPGEEIVRDIGGLHEFCGWNKPMLTDSGGFQLFSLAQLTKIAEEGAVFRSHIDGRKIELSPERSVAIQEALGADIAMVFDHDRASERGDKIEGAMERRCAGAVLAHAGPRNLRSCRAGRARHTPALRRRTVALDFPGYAISGRRWEEPREMYDCLDAALLRLPVNKPRYLMGADAAGLLEG